MELKSRKNVLCLIVVGLLTYAYAVNQMLRVRRGEVCSVIYELVTSFKAENRKVNVGDAWFWVSPLSLSLSVGVLVHGPSSALFWSMPAVEKIVFYIVFLFWSYQIGFSLSFYHEGHRLAEKLFLIIFIFW